MSSLNTDGIEMFDFMENDYFMMESLVTRKNKFSINDLKFPAVLIGEQSISAHEVMKQNGFIIDQDLPVKKLLRDSIGGGGAYSTVNISQINSLAIDNVFLGWGELSLLQQNALINTICSIFSHSMTSKWIEFYSNAENKDKKINELEKVFSDHGIKDKCSQAIYKTILLGTAYIHPRIKDDQDDLNTELIISPLKIPKGSVTDFVVIEPTWVVPLNFNMVNPLKENFYKPQKYTVFGSTVDKSRMFRMVYIEPVQLLSPIYLYGGVPLIQQLLSYILDYMNTKKQIVSIISRFNISVLKTNRSSLLKGTSDPSGSTASSTPARNLQNRLNNFNVLRNNFGILNIWEDEEFQQIQIPLTGLVDILQQQAEFISMASRIPVTTLFGQSPRGFQSTGAFDEGKFNQLIFSTQEQMLRSVLTKIMHIEMINLWGKIDHSINFRFKPLGEVNELDESKLKNAEIHRLSELVKNNILTPEEAKTILIKNKKMQFESLYM